MSKTLHKAARGLAALGRGEDKMLVHMTPREVEGLQALAVSSGGSLTVNPKTGLLEAGWLSTLLPMVAGAAATYFSGGTLAPLVAGALGGGVGAKIEGEDPMMGAVGGAFGGAFGGGLTSGLIGRGASALGQQAGAQVASQAATDAALQSGMQSLGQGAMANSAAALTPGSSMNALQGAAQAALPSAQTLSGVTPSMNAAQIAGQKAAEQAAVEATKQQALKAGIGSLGEKGAATSLWDGLSNSAKLGAATTAMGAANAASTSSGGGGKKKKNPYYYMTSAEIDPNGYVSFGPGMWSKNYNYETLGTYNPNGGNKYAIKNAEGGAVEAPPKFTMPAPPVAENPNPNQQYMANLQQLIRQPPPMPSQPYQQELPTSTTQPNVANPAVASQFGNILRATMLTGKKKKKNSTPQPVKYDYDINTGTFTKLAGGGGISELPEANSVPTAGRFIKGPGDGVSDSIPAMINGQQPAALSNNEFVVDAMTMAKLGNGSPEAGAQRMYQWQQRVHSLPTAPGKDLKADKYLPV